MITELDIVLTITHVNEPNLLYRLTWVAPRITNGLQEDEPSILIDEVLSLCHGDHELLADELIELGWKVVSVGVMEHSASHLWACAIEPAVLDSAFHVDHIDLTLVWPALVLRRELSLEVILHLLCLLDAPLSLDVTTVRWMIH